MYSQTEYIMKWYQSKTMCFPASLIIIQLCTDEVLQNTNHCTAMAKWHSLPIIYTFFCLAGTQTFLAIHSTVVLYALHSFLLSWHWELLMILSPQLTGCYPLMNTPQYKSIFESQLFAMRGELLFDKEEGPTWQERGRKPGRKLIGISINWYLCQWGTTARQGSKQRKTNTPKRWRKQESWKIFSKQRTH